MKAPPKRKGNNKDAVHSGTPVLASMKAPPKRKGNEATLGIFLKYDASMKAPPKRKGNVIGALALEEFVRLNESPSEKEGKFVE